MKMIQDCVFVLVLNALVRLSERRFVRFMMTSPPTAVMQHHMFTYTAFNLFYFAVIKFADYQQGNYKVVKYVYI